MHFNSAIASAILLFAATGLAAPLPQLAGEGAAANSILSSTDNGVGYGIENAEDNTAALIASAKGGSTGGAAAPAGPPPPKAKRQLAGEGAAANSILSSTDNGVGYGIENAEDNTAGLITSLKGGVPAVPAAKRQLDKIANGAGAIGNAAGVGATTDPVVSTLDNVDGTSTSGAANAGAQVGSTEESTLEGVGKAVPKERRQLDKIANGAGAIGNAAGVGSITDPGVTGLDGIDGTSTSAAADAGAEIGSAEEGT